MSRPRKLLLILVLAAVFVLAGISGGWYPVEDSYDLTQSEVEDLETLTSTRMQPFGSVAAVTQFTGDLRDALNDDDEEEAFVEDDAEAVDAGSTATSGATQQAANAGAIGVLRAMTGSWSTTNVQVGGIDEGDIVKVHRQHLIVLRRGRLFTVRLDDPALPVVSMADVAPPGTQEGWYDELLVSGDTLVVLAYRYDHHATELNLFHIDDQGQIARTGLYYLRSGDYYSSQNYATRLIGSRLIVYTPANLPSARHPQRAPIALRDGPDGRWLPIVDWSHFYRPIQPATDPVFHTIVSCDLARSPLRCTAQGVLAPYDATHYVSSDAVYLWIAADERVLRVLGRPSDELPDVLYRLPLDGGPIGAVRVRGWPFNFLAMHRDEDGHFYALVDPRAERAYTQMRSEIAVVRIPIASIGADVRSASSRWYTALPGVPAWSETAVRFVGDHALYGTTTERDDNPSVGRKVHIVAFRSGQARTLRLEHGVNRIEPMGELALVTGSRGEDLVFSAVRLKGTPAVVARTSFDAMGESESRSHAFAYHPFGATEGLLALPVRHTSTNDPPGVVFLRMRNNELTQLGQLTASPRDPALDDHCVVSCTGFYGSARPIFLADRIFALIEYELVEATLQESISERHRVHLYRDRPQAP